MSEEERYLREMLEMLRENYEKAAKPYVDRLAENQAILQPRTVIATAEQSQMLSLIPARIWQPIETAPTDGRQILTWRSTSCVLHVDFGAWYQTSFWSKSHSLVGWPAETQPTHWMPLPEAPKEETK